MKRIALAVLLSLGAPFAFAAADTVPAHSCGTIPEYPGRLGTDNQKKVFDKAYKAYDKCIRAYIEDRVATIKANETTINKIVDDTNTMVLKMRADSGEDVSKDGSAPAKADVPNKGGTKY